MHLPANWACRSQTEGSGFGFLWGEPVVTAIALAQKQYKDAQGVGEGVWFEIFIG